MPRLPQDDPLWIKRLAVSAFGLALLAIAAAVFRTCRALLH